MSKFKGLFVAASVAFSALANSEIIVIDPTTVPAGTNITHMFEGTSLYSSGVDSNGVVSYDAIYAADCTNCRPAVNSSPVLAQHTSDTTFDYEITFMRRLSGQSTYSSEGEVLLVDFDAETNYVQIVGAQGNGFTNLQLDIWDNQNHLIGTCNSGSSGSSPNSLFTAGCNGTATFTPADANLPLWELSFTSELANIGFITVGGSSGPGYVKSVSFSVPEPGSLAILSAGFAGLLLSRRRKISKSEPAANAA